MAFASSSSAVSAVHTFATFLPVSKKLTRSNHPLWRAQVLSSIRGAQLGDFIAPNTQPPSQFLEKKGADDKEPPIPNPDYATWVAKDRQYSNYLLSNLGREILAQVSMEFTASGA